MSCRAPRAQIAARKYDARVAHTNTDCDRGFCGHSARAMSPRRVRRISMPTYSTMRQRHATYAATARARDSTKSCSARQYAADRAASQIQILQIRLRLQIFFFKSDEIDDYGTAQSIIQIYKSKSNLLYHDQTMTANAGVHAVMMMAGGGKC